MTVSRQDVAVQVGPLALTPTGVRVGLDESRVPFTTADLTIPYDPATVDLLDPRTDARLWITLEQRFNGARPLAYLTTEYAGRKLSHLTTEYAGRKLRDLTTKYGVVWNAFGYRESRRLVVDVGVRDRRIHHDTATVDLVAASDEALLMDYGLLATSPRSPVALTVGSAVRMVLDTVLGPTYTLVGDPAAQTITADAAVWYPGVSGWEYLTPVTASAGLRLWCDQARVWHLAAPQTITVPGTTTLSGTGTVVTAADTVSRDAADWFDGVVITYTWTDTGGVRHTDYDIAGDANTSRVMHVTYDRPYPRAGEAAARLRKQAGHGRVLDVDAVTDPLAYPGQGASLSVPGTPTQTGYVQAVEFTYPADRMHVTTRGLVDTPPTSWVAAPEGVTWTDIPAGMRWTNLSWEGLS